MKAKVKCDKSLGWMERRKDTKVADTKGKAPGELLVSCALSTAKWIVVWSTGAVIQIQPLQLVASTLKTMPPVPELTVPATLLFLGDSLSLPKIETLQVDESKADSAPPKRLKTDNMNKEQAAKIAEAVTFSSVPTHLCLFP